MIDCKFFYEIFVKQGIEFFTGVPDSLLKDFCDYVTDHATPDNHIIAANEGGAVAIACGHYLSTSRPALVYMQNSGQGNSINPLVSLANQDVYSIPMLLLIGWRGEPGEKDEPQHIKQGKITISLLDTLNIPYRVLPRTIGEAQECLEQVFTLMKKTMAPVALVVRKRTFEPYELQRQKDCCPFELKREDAVRLVVDNLDSLDIVVATTGRTSRELYEYRDQTGGDHSKDFLTVGSMGHSSQIALGIALEKPTRQVFCLDGDGATIMHMGALAIIGSQKASNFKHIILNNGVHDSVGGQPTAAFDVSFTAIARACGYKLTLQAEKHSEIAEKMAMLKSVQGPALLEIRVKKGARENLGRPKRAPKENKLSFMKFLSQ